LLTIKKKVTLVCSLAGQLNFKRSTSDVRRALASDWCARRRHGQHVRERRRITSTQESWDQTAFGTESEQRPAITFSSGAISISTDELWVGLLTTRSVILWGGTGHDGKCFGCPHPLHVIMTRPVAHCIESLSVNMTGFRPCIRRDKWT